MLRGVLSSAAMLALLLAAPAGADTSEPASPIEAWTDPPADGDHAGEPQGTAHLSDHQLPIQTKVTVDQIYMVGPDGMEPGDGVRVEDPVLHGAQWSKYGSIGLSPKDCTPLTAEPRKSSQGVVTAATTGKATLSIERNEQDYAPHVYGYTDVWIEHGRLEEGDEIRLRFGDTAARSVCAHQTPDRAFAQVPWRVFEQVDGSLVQLESPTFDTLADDEVALLWVSAQSIAVAGETVILKIAVLDFLGNPVPSSGLSATLEAAYGGASLSPDGMSPGWGQIELVLDEPGVHRIAVEAGEHAATSNPILVLEDEPSRRLFWGDLHSHHGHTRVLEDGERVDQNHAYARDVVGLDVGCESMKLPPVEIDGEALWLDLQRACEADTTDGEYIALLGFEWMGQTRGDGHHNAYFDDCEGILPNHEDIPGLGDDGGLLEQLTDLESDRGTRSVLVAHASPYTGHNWRDQDNKLRTVAEVWSGWGDSLEVEGTESVEHALAVGNRMGFIASSDNHDGWFGNPLGRLGYPAGMAAFWAPALTRGDILDALQQRHTYASTGARIIVDFHALAGDEILPAGSLFVPDQVLLGWEVHGTDEIESVQLRGVPIGKGTSTQTLYEEAPGVLDTEGSWALDSWTGRTWALWLRVEQADGQIAWSSPVWITDDCGTEDVQDPVGICAARDADGKGDGPCGCAQAERGLPWWWAGLLLVGWRRRSR